MVKNVKEQLEVLAELQQIESSIGRLEEALAEVDQKLASLDRELLQYIEEVENANAELNKAKEKYAADESEVRTLTDMIAKSEAKLGTIKTNKEYQAALKEIDEMKKSRSNLEETMIEILEQIEAAEKLLAEKQKFLEDQRAEIEEQKKDVVAAASGKKKELEKLQKKAGGIVEKVEPRLYQTYTRIKKNGGGVGVAAVANAVCQVCNMNIPPQAFNELLRMDEIKICPHCQRIIYPKEEVC